MDDKIVKLYKNGKFKEISNVLMNVSADSLIEFVDDHVRRQKYPDNQTTILRALFSGFNQDRTHLASSTLVIFLHCLDLLSSPDVSQEVGTDIIGIMLIEVEKLSAGGLVDIIKALIELTRKGITGNGRALQVLPKVIMCIEQQREIHLDSGQGSMSGFEYKKQIINTLCSGKWSSKSVIHLANIFKDIPMSSEELASFLKKMLRQIERLDVQEIPPLAHQILSLAERSHYELILSGVFNVFDKLERDVSDKQNKPADDWNEMFEIEELESEASTTDIADLRAAQGTVLLHLTNMVRWEQSLGKSFVKMLKIAKDALIESTFSRLFLGFALSLSHIKKFQDEVLGILRMIIFRCFLSEHRGAKSNWLKQRDMKVPDMEASLQNVLEACKFGWDQVISGVILLGFSLMDSYGPKSGPFGRQSEGDPLITDSPQQKCCDVGASLLASVFKSHPVTRTEIVELLLHRVITRASSPCSHFIDVLKGIAKKYPTTLLESKHKLREFFECLCMLSPHNADRVLRAIFPLIQINTHLRDSLILVLRKALFCSKIEGRVIACNGFLLCLQNFKVDGFVSLSQASSQSSQSIFSISSQIHVDVHSSSAGPSSSQVTNYEPLCLEVLSTLRRCLTQQAAVRSALYLGLYSVISANPHLAGPCLEKLLDHFSRYYESHEGVLPPLKVEKCVTFHGGEPDLGEPLPLLLSSLLHCVKRSSELSEKGASPEIESDAVVDQTAVLKINEMFESLTTRMIKCDMEDFDLDKTADYSNNTNVGKKNCVLANSVLGVYQVLVEYNYLQDDLNEEKAKAILNLLKNYRSLRDVCSGKRDAMGMSSYGLVSPLFLRKIIEDTIFIKDLFCDESPDKAAALLLLRENGDFVKYVLDVTTHNVTQAKEHGIMKGIGGQSKTLVQETCMTAGQACLRKFMQDKNDSSNASRNLACLELFYVCLQYIIHRKKKRLTEFLTSCSGTSGSINATGVDITAKHVRRFQRIAISYLSEDVTLSSSARKILPVLVSVMDLLSSSVSSSIDDDNIEKPRLSSTPFSGDVAQLNEWIGKLCHEQTLDDAHTTKAMIGLHLQLSTQCGPWTGTDKSSQGSEGALRDMAKDIHSIAGEAEPSDDEEESRIEERKRGTHYAIIDECNVMQLVPVMVTKIDMAVEETEWLLQRLKGLVTAAVAEDKLGDPLGIEESRDKTDFHERRRKIEKTHKFMHQPIIGAMCVRIGVLLIAYRELIQAAIPVGLPVEHTLKGLSKLYTLLTNLAKYYIWLISQSVTQTPSAKFEKLAKLCGSEVTRYVYPFINYVESAQSCRVTEAAAARKRKRKDKTGGDEGATNAGKSRVLRETRTIPPLIYSIETFERFLISLGRKCKTDLLSGHKLPTSRDFRIKSAVIKEALARNEEQSEEEAENEESPDKHNQENDEDQEETATKRPRKSD